MSASTELIACWEESCVASVLTSVAENIGRRTIVQSSRPHGGHLEVDLQFRLLY